MNINYSQGIVLIVIACVLHSSCAKTEKPSKKSDKQSEKVSSKFNHKDDKKSPHVEKNSAVEETLLKIATIIQRCIDERTMNNKDFKIKLDKLYFNLVMPGIKKLLDKQLIKVTGIQEKYEKDLEVLKIMKSMPDSESSKNKDKSSKKTGKK